MVSGCHASQCFKKTVDHACLGSPVCEWLTCLAVFYATAGSYPWLFVDHTHPWPISVCVCAFFYNLTYSVHLQFSSL